MSGTNIINDIVQHSANYEYYSGENQWLSIGLMEQIFRYIFSRFVESSAIACMKHSFKVISQDNKIVASLDKMNLTIVPKELFPVVDELQKKHLALLQLALQIASQKEVKKIEVLDSKPKNEIPLQKKEELEKIIAANQLKVEELTQENENLLSNQAILNQKLAASDEVVAQVETHKQTIKSLEQIIESNKAETQKLIQQNKKLLSDQAVLNKNLAASDEVAAQVHMYKQTVESLNHTIESNKTETKKLAEQNRKLLLDLAALNKSLADSNQVATQVDGHKQTIESLKQIIESNEKTINNLNKQNQEFRDLIEASNSEKAEVRKTITEALKKSAQDAEIFHKKMEDTAQMTALVAKQIETIKQQSQQQQLLLQQKDKILQQKALEIEDLIKTNAQLKQLIQNNEANKLSINQSQSQSQSRKQPEHASPSSPIPTIQPSIKAPIEQQQEQPQHSQQPERAPLENVNNMDNNVQQIHVEPHVEQQIGINFEALKAAGYVIKGNFSNADVIFVYRNQKSPSSGVLDHLDAKKLPNYQLLFPNYLQNESSIKTKLINGGWYDDRLIESNSSEIFCKNPGYLQLLDTFSRKIKIIKIEIEGIIEHLKLLKMEFPIDDTDSIQKIIERANAMLSKTIEEFPVFKERSDQMAKEVFELNKKILDQNQVIVDVKQRQNENLKNKRNKLDSSTKQVFEDMQDKLAEEFELTLETNRLNTLLSQQKDQERIVNQMVRDLENKKKQAEYLHALRKTCDSSRSSIQTFFNEKCVLIGLLKAQCKKLTEEMSGAIKNNKRCICFVDFPFHEKLENLLNQQGISFASITSAPYNNPIPPFEDLNYDFNMDDFLSHFVIKTLQYSVDLQHLPQN